MIQSPFQDPQARSLLRTVLGGAVTREARRLASFRPIQATPPWLLPQFCLHVNEAILFSGTTRTDLRASPVQLWFGRCLQLLPVADVAEGCRAWAAGEDPATAETVLGTSSACCPVSGSSSLGLQRTVTGRDVPCPPGSPGQPAVPSASGEFVSIDRAEGRG